MTPEPRLEVGERLRLMRDGLLNGSSYAVSGGLTLLTIPLLLHGLGPAAYGLLLSAAALAGLAGLLDPGLEWSVTREIAAARPEDREPERFVRSACNASLLLALATALVIAAAGRPMGARLGVDAELQRLAPAVFALAGAAFVGDQAVALALAALAGLRRFDLVNALGIGVSLLRSIGIVVLLQGGAGIVAIAAWQAAASAAGAAAGLLALGRVAPRFRFRLAPVEWAAIRGRLASGFSAVGALAVGAIYWHLPQLLAAAGGSEWVVQYHVGQKLPVMALTFVGMAAGALLPAASERDSARDIDGLRGVLEVGTRWTIVLALPVCVALFVLAPGILTAWLGEAPAGAVLIMRLAAATALLDAASAGPIEVLWGRGSTRPVVVIFLAFTAGAIGLGVLLMLAVGMTGAAWAMLIAMAGGSAALLRRACRACELRLSELLASTLRGLPLAVAACAGVTLGMVRLSGAGDWAPVAAAAMSGGGAFAVALWWRGSRAEERLLAREMAGLPKALLDRLRSAR